MSKKLSYADKVALAAYQFECHKGLKEVYVCANGEVFFKENGATNHTKERKLSEAPEKITPSDVEKEGKSKEKSTTKASK